jgi:hypothetical protein
MMAYPHDEVRILVRHAALLGFQQGFRCKTTEDMIALDLDAMCAQVLRQMEHDGIIHKEVE